MRPWLQLHFFVFICAALKQRLVVLPARAGTLLLALVLLFAPLAQAIPNTAVAPVSTHGINLAPAGLVAAIARTQTQEAAQNPAYAIGHSGCAKLSAPNNTPHLAGCFDKTGPVFSTGKQTLHLRLRAWGRVGHLRSVTLTRTTPEANRIEYRGQHLTEWWRVLPLGYEQGFTLNQAPVGNGKIVLQLSTSRMPKIEHGQLLWGALRYGKLQVTDAVGQVLPATLSTKGKTITLAFDASHAHYPVSVDPLVWMQQQEVTAAHGAVNDNFGLSIALSANGRTALVGADGKIIDNNGAWGMAYVYTLANGVWSQTAELSAPNGVGSGAFGYSVALSADGQTALVGAYLKTVGSNNGQGAAYVYTALSGGWATTSVYTAELTAANGAGSDYFGSSVALSANGSIALVGANFANGNEGAAYVYTEPSSGWATTSTYTAELTAANGAALNYFGWSVALSAEGRTALVGAWNKTVATNSDQGAAYVYTEPNSGWATTSTYTAELTTVNGVAGDEFGASVALSAKGRTALVGADGKNVGINFSQGAAYVYTEPSGGWATTSAYTAELTATNGAADDYFGASVAISGNGSTALVGALCAPYSSSTSTCGPGAAYVYIESSGGWAATSAYTAELTAMNGVAQDGFSKSIALSADGHTALVGADGKTINSNNQQGAAYFFGNPTDLSSVFSTPTNVQTNTQFSSQYILTNASTTASAALTVLLPLPTTGASYVSATATQGSCSYDSTAKVATCKLGSIAGNGGTASAALTLKVTGTWGSVITQSGQLANASPNLSQTTSTTILPPPPVADGLGNVSVAYGQNDSETFTIAGTGTLIVTALSTNTTLLPNANITGASACTQAGGCTLALTPAAGQSGTATITVKVADSYGQSGSGTFELTVKAAPVPTSGGGGALGPWSLTFLLSLLLLAAGWRRRQSYV